MSQPTTITATDGPTLRAALRMLPAACKLGGLSVVLSDGRRLDAYTAAQGRILYRVRRAAPVGTWRVFRGAHVAEVRS